MGLTNHHASTSISGNSLFVNKWEKPLGVVLHHLDDLIFLQGTRFARLSGVRRLAIKKYPVKSLPEARVIVDIIKECVGKISVEFGNDSKYYRASKYLDLTVTGLKCREIAHELTMSREHCTRHVRPQALCLLAHQFVLIIRNKPSGVPEKLPLLIS